MIKDLVIVSQSREEAPYNRYELLYRLPVEEEQRIIKNIKIEFGGEAIVTYSPGIFTVTKYKSNPLRSGKDLNTQGI